MQRSQQPFAQRGSFSRGLFDRQAAHLLLLIMLLIPVAVLSQRPEVVAGDLWGWSGSVWFWLAIATAIAHQVYVWLVWRLELHAQAITRVLPDTGFTVFKVVFAILGLGRFLILPLAVANHGTFALPDSIQWGVSFILLLLSGYLFYSVLRYFGLERAAGLDHFDRQAREWLKVNKGIFRYTSNGMYVFGFLVLWVPGLIFESAGALLVAAFHHLYIWVHYYCTEQPDMEHIYGER